jgi:hypothetical protein
VHQAPCGGAPPFKFNRWALLQSLAAQLFAASLFPYLAFLFFLTRSGKAPRLMLFGFYFLLVGAGACCACVMAAPQAAVTGPPHLA